MFEYINNWVTDIGLSPKVAVYMADAIVFCLALLCSACASLALKRVIMKTVPPYVKKSKNKWDDLLVEHRVFERLHHLAPALVIYGFAHGFSSAHLFIERAAVAYMVIISLLVFSSLLDAVEGIYRSHERSNTKPIKGYLQTFKILLFVVGFVVAVAIILDRSPWILLSGVGAMAAAMILIFKESVLGFVASVQITANNMVCLGDWIEVPKYQANGIVVDITLHIIKIKNWDNTVTTLPTYSLISESFKNWKGMMEAGTRLIKRSINVDITSVGFCSEDLIDKIYELPNMGEVLKDEKPITNIYLLRKYIEEYLQNHESIDKGRDLIVRNLSLTDTGLPVEIYCFAKFESWEAYEKIQNEIFDHIYGIIPSFGLRIYQRPGGYDIRFGNNKCPD